jgi:hypothetical protein
MRWAGHVARIGQGRGVYRILVVKSEGKRSLGKARPSCYHNIKIELQEVDFVLWTESKWIKMGTGGGHCECGNESSVTIQSGEFLDFLQTG